MVPPPKHVILGLSDFFLMTRALRFPVMSRGWLGKGERGRGIVFFGHASPSVHICPLVLLMAACLPRGVQTEVGAGPGQGQWPASDVGLSALPPTPGLCLGSRRATLPRVPGQCGPRRGSLSSA